MINQGKKVYAKASNLLDNTHQGGPTARAIARVSFDRRMGLRSRMVQRQQNRLGALMAAGYANQRSNFARAYRSVRNTPAPIGGPRAARAIFKVRGRSTLPRLTR